MRITKKQYDESLKIIRQFEYEDSLRAMARVGYENNMKYDNTGSYMEDERAQGQRPDCMAMRG